MDTSESTRGSARQGFMRRLGYYAIGIAIGFVLLGFFQQRRAGERFLREQAAATGQLERSGGEAVGAPSEEPDSPQETPEVGAGGE